MPHPDSHRRLPPLTPAAARLLPWLSLVLLSLSGGAFGQSLDEARALHGAGKLDEALAAYRAVAARPDTAASAGTALNNACTIHMDKGDYEAALEACRKALTIRRPLENPPRLARTLNNLGLVLHYLGEYPEARRHFLEALAINRRQEDAESQVINLSNLGLMATAEGRYGEAIAFHQKALDLALAHAQESWAREQVQVVHVNRGVVLEKVGAFQEALELYRDLLRDEGTWAPARRASVQVNLGAVYRNLGDPRKALEAYRAAAETYERLGHTAALSNAHLNMGLAYHLNLRQLDKAEKAYARALELARRSGDRTEEIQDLFYMGRLLIERGRPEKAEEVFRACHRIAEQSASAEGRWSALEGLGRVAEARGALPQALDHLRRAMDEIERVRAGLARGSFRSGYFGDKRAVYGAAVRVLFRLSRLEPDAAYTEQALEVAERAKARDLLDALGRGGRHAQPLTGVQLREQAGGDLLLEYFSGEGRAYLWTIRRDGIGFFDVGPIDDLGQRAANVHRELSHGRAPEPSDLAALSRQLLGPIGSLPSSPSRLIIAPDGPLHYLPFELLEEPGSPGSLLLERAAVSYLPSASARAWLHPPPEAPELALAAFASPVFAAGGARRHPLLARFDLEALPASLRELASARVFLRGKHDIRIGEQATEEAFRTVASRGARVIHLATHTVVDERLDRGAAILFTPSGEDDGLMFAEEVAALDARVTLTVLASCRTALSTPGRGGALGALAGSFLAAGSPAVVATLWDVGDEATSAFMEQFYYFLGRGLAPAEALKAAKERLRSQAAWRSPSLWAPYVLFGDTRALSSSSRVPLWAWALLALAALGAVAAYRRRGRKARAP